MRKGNLWSKTDPQLQKLLSPVKLFDSCQVSLYEKKWNSLIYAMPSWTLSFGYKARRPNQLHQRGCKITLPQKSMYQKSVYKIAIVVKAEGYRDVSLKNYCTN